MRGNDASSPRVAITSSQAGAVGAPPSAEFEIWRNGVRQTVLAHLADFVDTECVPQLDRTGIDIASEVLIQFADAGKCLRSTFMYLGWLSGAEPDGAALRACAGLELLQAFALLQDDVMDDSALRRGRPAAHVQFAQWHRDHGLSGSQARFGASLATLLSDLCLVWAEQMMRESGVDQDALSRAWPRYDVMRVELAAGQMADVANDAGALPDLDTVLDLARRKSGNYTVRRPLEIGAAMAGCHELIGALGRYGNAVGEAFQLRDDILGVFGSPAVTGKPAGGDLAERKATSVVVAARHMADTTIRRQFTDLMNAEELTESDIVHWRNLIVATGAPDWIEDLINERVAEAIEHICDVRIDDWVQSALADMASVCTRRVT
ncbi:MAG: polyprenyl synthetase family protein [Mycolicibacterium sp.]|nr:polyprenyl synthetase family protein [Mycolicibacterium sp.]